MFIDIAKIKVKAGDGGDGAVAFHREKYVASGGPDGGDGGRGGDIVFRVDDNLSTLADFRYKRKYTAERGENGRGKRCFGKSAQPLVITVPRGTLIRNAETGRIMADMSTDEDVVIAKGGRGGWGNTHFASPTRQTPRFAKPGTPGEAFELQLELKLLADVGLVGFPNVGKSTLVSVVSEAKPNIANYHFTTITPVLGVVHMPNAPSFVMADIPGLIEGAWQGVGLGHQFLRHVERCRMLIHIVDVSGSEGRDPIDDFDKINQELERYTNHADKTDYALSVAGGVLAGLVDSLFVGEFSLEYANQWGNQQAEKLVLKVAKYQGYGGTDPAQAIKHLEDQFPIAADKATAAFGGGLQHHLRDFSHHPTPVGLVCSILTQFTGNVYGTDVAGAFQCVPLNKDGLNLVGKSFPEKIMFGAVNWFFHMVSDVAGSSGTVMKGSFGTGLPGPLVSLLKEFSSTRLFKKQDANGYKEFSVYISKLFNGTLLGERDANGDLIPLKFDLRTEMGVAAQIGQQTIPVIINECFVRVFYSLRRLLGELSREDIQSWGELDKINWKAIIPFRNRTVDRMLTIASMTFTVADTADAAVHAAIESGGNWVLFSGRFVARFNYVGAGRAALSIVRGVSNEKKEAQLIHEKMILSEAKAALFLKQLQEFKEQLDRKVSNYLAEDIEGFMAGFADMRQGLAGGDSNLVIRGNVTIQKVLGREPQFTNQKEFDALMGSDAPLVL